MTVSMMRSRSRMAAPAILLRDRIIETVIGAAVGIAVVLAPTLWRRLRRA